MENEYGRGSSVMGGFYRFIVKGLNIMAWITLSIIAIGIAVAYVTDHKLSIIHNENPPAVESIEKSGG